MVSERRRSARRGHGPLMVSVYECPLLGCQSYRRQIGEWGLGAPECRDPITLLAARLKNLNKWLMGMRRNAWRHLIGGTVRNLSSWPLDPVVYDLSRFPKGFGRGRKRHRCRQPQPIFIVYRHDETRLASEIETMEMVSLRLEDHGLPSHAVLNASSLARGSPRNPAIMHTAANISAPSPSTCSTY